MGSRCSCSGLSIARSNSHSTSVGSRTPRRLYLPTVPDSTRERVIGACQQLYKIAKAFRTAKSDLCVRPVCHHLRESIEAHLCIVFAAMAMGHWIETTTGWFIKKFVTTTRRHRTTWVRLGTQTLPANGDTTMAEVGSQLVEAACVPPWDLTRRVKAQVQHPHVARRTSHVAQRLHPYRPSKVPARSTQRRLPNL